MASKSLQTSRMLVLSAVFISLSVGSVQSRECYWCGPLAEQVHRSQRAPSCSAPLEATACEPGLAHCATVATAPPYVESRYCVKLYQDECYPLFCNSTRTWRMICACRGDLCNGPNTDREKEAFAILNKLVSKPRNKRTINATSGLTQDNNMPSNEFEQSDQLITTVLVEGNNESLTTEQNVSGSSIVPEPAVSYRNVQAENEPNVENFNVNAEIQIDYQSTKDIEAATTKLEVIQNDVLATGQDYMKAKGQLPTAEALQHHVSPQIKQTETITTETTITTNNRDFTIPPPTPTKNFGVSVHTQLSIIRILAIVSIFFV